MWQSLTFFHMYSPPPLFFFSSRSLKWQLLSPPTFSQKGLSDDVWHEDGRIRPVYIVDAAYTHTNIYTSFLLCTYFRLPSRCSLSFYLKNETQALFAMRITRGSSCSLFDPSIWWCVHQPRHFRIESTGYIDTLCERNITLVIDLPLLSINNFIIIFVKV